MSYHADKVRPIFKKPAKAGVLLYEDVEGKRQFLVPYNEGRFAKDGEYFVLPKGSVDYRDDDAIRKAEKNHKPRPKFDSSAIDGGIRETEEETGIPLREILGKENIKRLEAGEIVHNITNPKFPGFEIVTASPQQYPHKYHARGGIKQKMVMYGFEVKGLETLSPYLKNKDKKTTKQFLDERGEDLPRFPTFLEWMKKGYIPADPERDLPEVKLFKNTGWFDRTIRELAPEGIEVPGDWQATREKWQAFCASLDKGKHEEASTKFHRCFHLIKQRLFDQGVLKSDLDILKFDEKDCPLFYYTEGAVIEGEEHVICKTLTDIKNNPDYDRAFGGVGTREQNLTLKQTRMRGQVWAWKPFVDPDIWSNALHDIMGIVDHVREAAQKVIGKEYWRNRTRSAQETSPQERSARLIPSQERSARPAPSQASVRTGR